MYSQLFLLAPITSHGSWHTSYAVGLIHFKSSVLVIYVAGRKNDARQTQFGSAAGCCPFLKHVRAHLEIEVGPLDQNWK